MADYGAGIVYPQVGPIAGAEQTAAGYQSAANALSQGANQAASTAAQARTAKYEMEMRMKMQERQNLVNGISRGVGALAAGMWRKQERKWEVEDLDREERLEREKREALGYFDEMDQGMNLDPYLWGPHAAGVQEAYTDYQTWNALQGRVAGELFNQDLYNYRYNILDLGAKRSGIQGGAQGILQQFGGRGPESRPAPSTQPSGSSFTGEGERGPMDNYVPPGGQIPSGVGGLGFAPSNKPQPGTVEYGNEMYRRMMPGGGGGGAYDKFSTINSGRSDRVAEWGAGVRDASQKQAQQAQQMKRFEESMLSGISRADHMNTAITNGIPGVVQSVTQDPQRGPIAGDLFSGYVSTFSKDASQITPNDLTAPTPVLKAVNSWFVDLGDQLETALSNGVIADETSRQQARTVIGSINKMTYNFDKTVGKSFSGDRIVQEGDYKMALDLIAQGRHLDAMGVINRNVADAKRRFDSFRLSTAAQLNSQYAEEVRPIQSKLRRVISRAEKGWQAEADALIAQRETIRARYVQAVGSLQGPDIVPIQPPQEKREPVGVGGPSDW